MYPRMLLLAVLATALLFSTASADQRLPFQATDVFGLEWAADPQISPDGRQVAYVRRGFDLRQDKGQSAIWLVDTAGDGHRPLTSRTTAEQSPRWSPDGGRLAFVSAEGDGGAQIHVTWLATGVSRRITDLIEAPSALVWSPDGTSLAFVMRVANKSKPLKVELPEAPKGASWAEPLKQIDRVVYRADGAGFLPDAYAQVFTVPAEGGTPRQLTEGKWNHANPDWVPDSRSLVFAANRRADADLVPRDSELYQIDLTTGELTALTSRFGPDSSPAVSPDGKYIAYLGFDDRFQGYQRTRLYLMDRASGQLRELAVDLDRDLEGPTWSRDSKTIYASFEDRGNGHIAAFTLEGKYKVLATNLGGTSWSRPYSGGSFSVSQGGSIAYTANSVEGPAEVGLMHRGRQNRLTQLNADLLARRDLGRLEEISAKSSADGRDIQGWLLRPPGFDPAKQYPLILEIHGGPFANYGPRFAAEMQLYAAAGNNVLYVNPRGSTSYGEEFGNLIHHAYPGQDYDDLMSVVDAAIARGGVDADRLYVTGGSGGGVLSAWIVGKTQRFRAAAVQKPVINWTSFVLTADAANVFYKYWFAAPPWEIPEDYWQRSPLSLVGKVQTPTMVVTGELDFRTPIAESEQFYQALRLRGVDTLLVRVPGASHSLDQRPSQLISRIRHILAWFERYKDKGPGPSGPDPS